MIFRDLEKAKTIIAEATGLDITYAYDDLVFPEHVAFIVQFDDSKADSYFCYFHTDCIPEEKVKIKENLLQACKNNRSTMKFKGSYTLEQKGEEFEIKFL